MKRLVIEACTHDEQKLFDDFRVASIRQKFKLKAKIIKWIKDFLKK